MKKSVYLLSFFLFFTSCTRVIHYGYLPGSDFKYYEPIQKVDLQGKRINLIVNDFRSANTKIGCSEIELDRNSELEGSTGFDYFNSYCKAMVAFNNGSYDSTSQDTLSINLTGLSAKYYGIGYVKVYGLVEFEVNGLGISNKKYCSEMVDGDRDAPLKAYSFASRKTALRKMVSGSSRRVLENLMKDIQQMSSAL